MATHWIVVTETWKSRPKVARATATIVVSRIDMIDPSTTTVEVRRSSGDSVKEGASVDAMGILHNTQRSGIVKDFPGWDNLAMGVAEDVFERLRRITFEGEHVERMAALNARLKLSPGVTKMLMRLVQGGRDLHGRHGPGHRRGPVLHHCAGRRPGSAGIGSPGSLRPTTAG